jgi:hypothetical protein
MRAAVIRRSGATPVLDQFADPQPGQDLAVGTLVAAALNPLDLAIVNDQIPFRRVQPPYIAGWEAVVQLGDLRSWVKASPPRPPKCAAPPTRTSCVTRSTGGSPWTWSKPGLMTSARPGSTSRPGHRASSWSHPEPPPAGPRPPHDTGPENRGSGVITIVPCFDSHHAACKCPGWACSLGTSLLWRRADRRAW